MLQPKLIDLKDFILKYNPYLDNGYANVTLDNEVGIINDSKQIIFPSDKLGKYFYLRVPTKSTFEYSNPIADNALSIRLNSDIILVSYLKEGDADLLGYNIAGTIGRYQDVNTKIKEILFHSDDVVRQELGKLTKENVSAALQKMRNSVIVSIHFTMTFDYVFQQLNCIKSPCKDC